MNGAAVLQVLPTPLRTSAKFKEMAHVRQLHLAPLMGLLLMMMMLLIPKSVKADNGAEPAHLFPRCCKSGIKPSDRDDTCISVVPGEQQQLQACNAVV
jgi:hypothetical protein